MGLLKQINDVTERMIRGFLIAILIGILLVCFYQVATRFVFVSYAFAWTEEMARLLYLWGCFLGTAVLLRQKRLIRVDIISNVLPKSLFRAIEIIMLLSMLGFSLVLVVKGFEFCNSISQDRLTLLGHPRSWFWLPVPVAGVFACMYILEQILDDLGELFAGS
ncbi:MAG: TRAP transporter small permease [Firmicutes bacterium]|nr:TRAP transporter small permease [Bacillota bacterium]